MTLFIGVALIVADCIVVVSTWVKTYHSARNAWDLKLGGNTSAVMLTDGMSQHRALDNLIEEQLLLQVVCFFGKRTYLPRRMFALNSRGCSLSALLLINVSELLNNFVDGVSGPKLLRTRAG